MHSLLSKPSIGWNITCLVDSLPLMYGIKLWYLVKVVKKNPRVETMSEDNVPRKSWLSEKLLLFKIVQYDLEPRWPCSTTTIHMIHQGWSLCTRFTVRYTVMWVSSEEISWSMIHLLSNLLPRYCQMYQILAALTKPSSFSNFILTANLRFSAHMLKTFITVRKTVACSSSREMKLG